MGCHGTCGISKENNVKLSCDKVSAAGFIAPGTYTHDAWKQ